MSILDKKPEYELYRLYDELKIAKLNCISMQKRALEIINDIQLIEGYEEISTTAQKTFIDNLKQACISLQNAIPCPPEEII